MQVNLVDSFTVPRECLCSCGTHTYFLMHVLQASTAEGAQTHGGVHTIQEGSAPCGLSGKFSLHEKTRRGRSENSSCGDRYGRGSGLCEVASWSAEIRLMRLRMKIVSRNGVNTEVVLVTCLRAGAASSILLQTDSSCARFSPIYVQGVTIGTALCWGFVTCQSSYR